MSQSEPIVDHAHCIPQNCPLFCVLVIGPANAGKMTILQKVCNTTDDPEIHGRGGEKVHNLSIQNQINTDHTTYSQVETSVTSSAMVSLLIHL